MKKIMMILMIFMFAFTCVGGSVFILADIPAAVQEDKDKNASEDSGDNETSTTASGYWSSSSYYDSSFEGGTGTSSDPYLISNAGQLARLAYLSNSSSYYSSYNSKTYQLTDDIDLSAHYWIPIGLKYAFQGNFYGNYHTIKGMTCYMSSGTDSNYYATADNANSYICALFGKVYGDVAIFNFSLSNVSITTASASMSTKYYKFSAVAGLALASSDNTPMISNVNLFGNIKSSLTGTATEFLMAGAVCYTEGAVISNVSSYMTMYDSSNMSTSSSSTSICGGIAAFITSESFVIECAMLGYIDFYGFGGGNTYAGGIVGQLGGSSTLKTSYVTRGGYHTNTSSCYMWLSRHCGGAIAGNLSDGGSKVISCWSFLSVKLNSGGTGSTFKGVIVGYNNGTLTCNAYGAPFASNSTDLYGKQNGAISEIWGLQLSSFRQSSTFNTYMKKTGGENWYYGDWYYDATYYNHLNYGFPVLKASLCYVSTLNNDYTATSYVTAVGTGIDETYTSGGNNSTAISTYALIGGSLLVKSTRKAGCCYRGIYTARGDKVDSRVVDSNSFTTAYHQIGATTYDATYGSKNCYLQVMYCPPTTDYWQNNYASSFAGGSGTSSSPYLISNAEQLARLAYLSNDSSNYSAYQSKFYKLTADIDLSGKIWTPIGNKYPFTGDFNGAGYTINGLTCRCFNEIDPTYYVADTTSSLIGYIRIGLFGQVKGSLTNFVLTNVDIGDDDELCIPFYDIFKYVYIGAVCGQLTGNKTGSRAGVYKVGAFGSVSFYSVEGSMSMNVGGLVGELSLDASILESFNSAYVKFETKYVGAAIFGVGGLAGTMKGDSDTSTTYYPTIATSYNNGSVSSYSIYTGGLVGSVSKRAYMYRSYNIGKVSAAGFLGGLVGGESDVFAAYNCFSDMDFGNVYIVNRGGKYVSGSTSYKGVLCGGSTTSSVYSYCGYNSEKGSAFGTNTPSTTGLNSYTSSSTYRPNYNVSSYPVYTSGSATWSKTTTMATNSSATWTMPSSSYSYMNNRFPVLSWSLRYRSVATSFSQCGTTTINITGVGASDTRTTATSTYAILGSDISVKTTATSGSYGTYSGIYETNLSGTKELAVTETSEYQFTKTSSFNQVRIAISGSTTNAYVSFDVSSFTDSTNYKLCFVDNNTYSSANMNNAVSFSKIVFYKQTSSGSWSSVSLPSYTLSGATLSNNTLTVSAVTGNYYSSKAVRIYNSGNLISSLSCTYSYPTTYGTYVKGGVYSNGVNAYYGVYSGNPVTTITKLVAYTPTESGVNYPSSTSTCGSFTINYYTSGNPFVSTTTTTSSSVSTIVTSRAYRPTTFTINANIEAWQFKGWYNSTSSTISTSTCAGTPTSTSSSYVWTPTNTTTTYVYAVFVPRTTSTIFNGAWTSEDGGATYSRKNTSSITTDSVACTYPSAYIKYVKQTYSAIINETQTTQSSQTSSTMLVVHTKGKKYDLGINPSSNYEFEGWYYISDNLTSDNISTASCITTSTTFTTSTGTFPPGVFAKFKRKILTITAYVMTDESGYGTYTNTNTGGKPTYNFYNSSNQLTTQTMSSVSVYPNSIQSGTPIMIANTGVSSGYVYMGYSLGSGTSPNTNSMNTIIISSGTTTDITLRFYYKKVSGNTLQYISKNSTEYASDYTVSFVSGYNFTKNAAGFYESQNFGMHNSYALAKVTFNLKTAGDVTFDVINYAESSYDFGIFSNIDATLTTSSSADNSNVYKSFSGLQSPNITHVIYNNVSAGEHFVYVKYKKDGSANAGYDSLQFRLATELSNHSYYYFEHGKYPQSYVGDTLNNQMINDNANVTQTSSKISYFNGTSNVDIPIYKYNNEEYVRLKPDATFTIKLNGVSKTFSSSMYYYFKVEPIRWRVSNYEPTFPPTKWSSHGANYAGFSVVTDKILGVGAVNALTTKEGWRYVESNMYNNVKDSNSFVNPQLYFGTNDLAENWKYGAAGQQEKVVYDNGSIASYNGIRVAAVGEISNFASGIEPTINENTLAKYARAEYTDFVGFMLKKDSGVYGEYWTRNLGNGINNGRTIDALGFQKNTWLNQVRGVRFAVLFNESSRIF